MAKGKVVKRSNVVPHEATKFEIVLVSCHKARLLAASCELFGELREVSVRFRKKNLPRVDL